MKERPILFSGPMVRAILDGRKTQTRRIMKPQPTYDGFWWSHKGYSCGGEKQFRDGLPLFVGCPYGVVGDRLWVRETCCSDGWSVHYLADNDHREFGETRYDDVIKLHHYSGGFSRQVPSIHMPRWASRITLEITGVRVERLNEISESDAYREGVTIPSGQSFASNGNPELRNEARCAFQSLWNSINGPESWAANPFVWVIEFKRIETT